MGSFGFGWLPVAVVEEALIFVAVARFVAREGIP
jgi:hypothetical protein